MEQTELARRSRLSLETIKRLERTHGTVEANSRTLVALSDAFDSMGVVFDRCPEGLVGVCRARGGGAPRRTDEAGGEPRMGAPDTDLHRLIYHSRSTEPLERTRETLRAVWESSAGPNAERGVTGALFACDGYFLQVLEGGKDTILRLYGSISCDSRHEALKVLELRPAVRRQFPGWSLCWGLFDADDPRRAKEPSLKNGFRPDTLSPAEALGLLSIVPDLQDREERQVRRGSPIACEGCGSPGA